MGVQAEEDACEQIVREHPLRSVLVAAGIGWLFGYYWKRR